MGIGMWLAGAIVPSLVLLFAWINQVKNKELFKPLNYLLYGIVVTMTLYVLIQAIGAWTLRLHSYAD